MRRIHPSGPEHRSTVGQTVVLIQHIRISGRTQLLLELHCTGRVRQFESERPSRCCGVTSELYEGIGIVSVRHQVSVCAGAPIRDLNAEVRVIPYPILMDLRSPAIVHQDRSGTCEHIVRVLAAPPLAAFMQVGRGFAVRWSPWLCAGIRGCCRRYCRQELGFSGGAGMRSPRDSATRSASARASVSRQASHRYSTADSSLAPGATT